MGAKTVSVDLCGTLADCSPYDSLWYELMPRLYAERHKVSIDHAKVILAKEYRAVGPQRLEWYRPSYWIKKFSISEDAYIDAVKREVKIELPREVYMAGKRHRLILSTNVAMEVLSLTVDLSPFKAVYSSVDIGRPRKDSAFWQAVINNEAKIRWPFVHLGDDYVYDYLYPASLGIASRLASRFTAPELLNAI